METTDIAPMNADDGAVQKQGVSGSIEITTLDDVARLAQMMANSGFFSDARDASQAGVKIIAGMELDIPPMAAMREIHVFDGNTTLGGPMLAALIKRHPKYDYRIDEVSDDGAWIDFYEDGEQVGTSSFTRQDAEDAGLLGKQNWRKYKKDMYVWRAMARGQRWYCPDVGNGSLYTPDEMGAVTDAQGNLVEREASSQRGRQNGQSAPQQEEEVTDVDPEPTIEEKLQKAATYLERAATSGDPQKLRKAIDTVTERADEKLSGEDATRMHMVTTPYEILGQLRASVGDGEVDEDAFNAVLDEALPALAQLPEGSGIPGEQWGRSVVSEEAQRIEEAVDGFTIDASEDETVTDDEKAVQAMQNGETALGQAAAPEPSDELPERFPGRSYLMKAGIETMEEIVDKAALGELTSVDGIGEETAEKIRERLASMSSGDLFA